MKHRKEFPKENWLPRPLLECFARNSFKDDSWHNDACPVFINGGMTIFCEAKARAMRELRGPRYQVVDEDGLDIDQFEDTSDLICWLDQ